MIIAATTLAITNPAAMPAAVISAALAALLVSDGSDGASPVDGTVLSVTEEGSPVS